MTIRFSDYIYKGSVRRFMADSDISVQLKENVYNLKCESFTDFTTKDINKKMKYIIVKISELSREEFNSIEDITDILFSTLVNKRDIIVNDKFTLALCDLMESYVTRCSIEGCNAETRFRARFCELHKEIVATGDTEILKLVKSGTPCLRKNCTNKSIKFGYCEYHLLLNERAEKGDSIYLEALLGLGYKKCKVCEKISRESLCKECLNKGCIEDIIREDYNLYKQELKYSTKLRFFSTNYTIFKDNLVKNNAPMKVIPTVKYLYDNIIKYYNTSNYDTLIIILDILSRLDAISRPSFVDKDLSRKDLIISNHIIKKSTIKCILSDCNNKSYPGNCLCKIHDSLARRFSYRVLKGINSDTCYVEGCNNESLCCSLCKEHLIYAINDLEIKDFFSYAFNTGKLRYTDLDRQGVPVYSEFTKRRKLGTDNNSSNVNSFKILSQDSSKGSNTLRKSIHSKTKVISEPKPESGYSNITRRLTKISLKDCSYNILNDKFYLKGVDTFENRYMKLSIYKGEVKFGDSTNDYKNCEDIKFSIKNYRLYSTINSNDFMLDWDLIIDKQEIVDSLVVKSVYISCSTSTEFKYKQLKKSRVIDYYIYMKRLVENNSSSVINYNFESKINNNSMIVILRKDTDIVTYRILYKDLKEDIKELLKSERSSGKKITKLKM